VVASFVRFHVNFRCSYFFIGRGVRGIEFLHGVSISPARHRHASR
jgi:hypothetical protein